MLEDMREHVSVPQEREPAHDFVKEFLNAETYDASCIPPVVFSPAAKSLPLFQRSVSLSTA